MKFYVHYEGDIEFTAKIVLEDTSGTIADIIKKFTDDFNAKHGETKVIDPLRIQFKHGESKRVLKPTDRTSLIKDGDDVYANDYMPLDVPFECGRHGCNKTFTEAENTDTACKFHSGSALFHEGSKGWTCCSKRVLEFDEMLAIPGCTIGRHVPKEKSISKPKPKAEVPENDKGVIETYGTKPTVAAPKKVEKPKPVERPVEIPDPIDATIPVGAHCIHKTCNGVFKDDSSRTEECVYHPGDPVFHEGSKGWDCCRKMTLEFSEFLSIPGCTTGVHKFIKPPEPIKVRYDFYQTATFIIVTFYAKGVKKDLSSLAFEPKQFTVKLTLANGDVYQEQIPLAKTIDPTNSKYEVLGTKVEVKLRKGQAEEWDPFNLTGQ